MTTDTGVPAPRGFRAVSWQPTPERWAAYLAPPTEDQAREIIRRANAPTRTKSAKRRRIAPGGGG